MPPRPTVVRSVAMTEGGETKGGEAAADDGGKPARSRKVLAIGLPLALLTIIPSGLLAFLVALSCGGDGGSPYAARASPYGRACEAGLVSAWALVILLAPPVLAILGVLRLATSRRRRDLALAIGGPIAVFVAAIAMGAIVPSECSAAQREAGADCEVY